MTFDLNQDSLLKFLNKHGLEPTFQKETNQTFVLMQIKQVSVPIFFGLSRESGLLQVVAYLPYQLRKESIAEVARMLHILNKELDMPGFGMDEKDLLIFYRTAIPCLNLQVNEQLLTHYVATIRFACETFMHLIASIAAGTIKTEDYLNKRHG